ncbi:hypothetical protein MferCBS49748_007516 [Microsporum ferrugineum]
MSTLPRIPAAMRPIQNFHFVPQEEVENVCMYKPGGYHPIKLGDVFRNNRNLTYRVIGKLGHGSFATVWLAKDEPTGRVYGVTFVVHYVALKILTADATVNRNEAHLLAWLRDQSKEHPGYRHIAHVLDTFQVKGPNGAHDVLVMEPVASLFWMQLNASDVLNSHVKSFLQQVFTGLSYLHSSGVMHGDLHLGNLALALPSLHKHGEAELLNFFSGMEATVLLTLDPANQTDSLPPYVLPPINLVELVIKDIRASKSDELCVKIIDFGNAFRRGDPRPPPESPPYIRAPEVEIWQRSKGEVASDWGIQGDIWSMGCTAYDMIWGEAFFYLWGDKDVLLSNVAKCGGPLPTSWLPYIDSKHVGAASNPARDEEWDRIRDTALKYRPTAIPQPLWEENTRLMIDMIRKMLKADPSSRTSMKELVNHPWFGIEAMRV